MARSIDASVITELAKDDFNWVSLLYLGFSSPIYLTDAGRDVDSGGQTYTSSANMLSIGRVQEHADMRVGNLPIELSAADQTYVSLFLSNDYIDVRVQYYKALLDDSWALIGSAVQVFDGRISGFKIDEKGSSSKITIDCASHWANFEAINGRKTNDSSQKIHFSTDEGMAFASHNVRDIRWGRKNN